MVNVNYLKPFEDILASIHSPTSLKVRLMLVAGNNGTEATIGTIVKGLDDEAPEVRLAAVSAMNVIVAEDALPHLLRAMNDNSAPVRKAAADGLGHFWPEEPIVSALDKALHDRDEDVRKAAIDALSELGKPNDEMKTTLRRATENQDVYVANRARSIMKYWRVN